MDPIFGLTATKDSPALDAARQKNRSHEKQLQHKMSHIDEQCRSKTSKIISAKKDLALSFRDIHASSTTDKGLVLPRGMSLEDKVKYKEMRRNGMPSMSLEQFDNKLKELKRAREFRRGSIVYEEINKDKLMEKIDENDVIDFDTPSPQRGVLLRRRSIVKKASLGEISLPEINIIHRNSRLSNRRSSSTPKFSVEGNDVEFRPTVTKSNFVEQSLSPRPAAGNLRRRATMPNIQNVFSDEDTLARSSPTAAMSRLDDIIDCWRSSPALKLSNQDTH